jgi:imidazolonepropionase-like amidohydrolase
MRQLALSALLFLAMACASGSASIHSTPTLAIQNVTVIDATGAPAKPSMTVIVEGKRIVSIIPAATARIPRNARVLDGTGKFLIPGLWDMHTHLSFYGDEALTMLVRNGVLAIRDLGGSLEELDRWRAEIDRGTRIGPRIFRAGPYVDGPKKFDESTASGKLRKETTITVTTPEEARAAVAALKQRGVDTIKTHNTVPKDAFLALAAECHRIGVPLASHPPSQNMTIEEVSDARVTTLEHIEMLTESICFANIPPGGKPKDPLVALAELTDEYAMNLFRRFARNGTTYDPCLVAYRTFMQEAVDLAPKDPRYAPAAAGRTKMFNRFVELVGLMKRAGVQVVTGTDSGIRPETVPYPVPVPGSDLHDEMKLFVQGGLTPMEALQSATLLPARILGVADELGTIEAGKEANVLLLDADPLADIANSRTIAAVVFRGVVLDRAQLEKSGAAQ